MLTKRIDIEVENSELIDRARVGSLSNSDPSETRTSGRCSSSAIGQLSFATRSRSLANGFPNLSYGSSPFTSVATIGDSFCCTLAACFPDFDPLLHRGGLFWGGTTKGERKLSRNDKFVTNLTFIPGRLVSAAVLGDTTLDGGRIGQEDMSPRPSDFFEFLKHLFPSTFDSVLGGNNALRITELVLGR